MGTPAQYYYKDCFQWRRAMKKLGREREGGRSEQPKGESERRPPRKMLALR